MHETVMELVKALFFPFVAKRGGEGKRLTQQ